MGWLDVLPSGVVHQFQLPSPRLLGADFGLIHAVAVGEDQFDGGDVLGLGQPRGRHALVEAADHGHFRPFDHRHRADVLNQAFVEPGIRRIDEAHVGAFQSRIFEDFDVKGRRAGAIQLDVVFEWLRDAGDAGAEYRIVETESHRQMRRFAADGLMNERGFGRHFARWTSRTTARLVPRSISTSLGSTTTSKLPGPDDDRGAPLDADVAAGTAQNAAAATDNRNNVNVVNWAAIAKPRRRGETTSGQG